MPTLNLTTEKLTPAQVFQAKEELAKAFRLATDGIEVEMFSKSIDAAWHEMLESPSDYRNFCLDACGEAIDHTARAGVAAPSFISAYEQRFGPLPEIWFVNESGAIDAHMRNEYMQGKTIRASWHCTPSRGGGAPMRLPLKQPIEPIKDPKDKQQEEKKN